HGVYKDRDLSILSQREKEIMTLKIDGLTYQQIADRLDITSGCVGALIQKSRAKLDGTYRYNRYNRYMECIKIGTFPYCPSARKK
ncbi:LuxR C-terminal-related transcriptional regulator, partial [[Clostridium] symbiosum]|uniref:sigma factor-like helix-turn-helix DNA-binding protein n=1 Tax=Clostridium symbiosum TaxID=1512 RepID=UPI00210AF2CD